MSRDLLRKALLLGVVLLGLGSFSSARAQNFNDYLYWPYVPPQTPGNGFDYKPLYDGFYTYPREQRIVPQIQGPYYHNYYGGKRILGIRSPHGFHDWRKKRWYKGYHFVLDVF